MKEILKSLKWPTKYQWSQIFKISSKKELTVLLISAIILFGSIAAIGINYYYKNSVVSPGIGGTYSEALVGTVQYLNPLLSSTNEIDRDITRLVFAGLLKYDANGNLIPDLAEKYTILDDGKTYEVKLKQKIYWHDQKPLNADDVIFTIETLQDPAYRSPERKGWEGVTVEKVDDYTVRFKLKNAYAPFLQKLTLGLIPKHIWETIQPENFTLNENNLKPIGAGPYQFESIEKTKSGLVKSIKFKIHNQHYTKSGFIEHVNFLIYQSQDEAVKALSYGDVDGLGLFSAQDKTKVPGDTKIYSVEIPRYYSIYFDSERNNLLADKTIRQALAESIDKNELVKKILLGEGSAIDSPLPQNIFGDSSSIVKYNFNIDTAKSILKKSGWTDKNNDGVREKTVAIDKKTNKDIPLQISLTTADLPELNNVAQFIKDSWQKIGVKVDITTVNIGTIQSETIKQRDYQALLFGNVLRLTPDPYSFWHSSQKRDPGLNLSLYDNKTVDGLLLDARQDMNADTRKQKLNQFQKIVTEDIGAIFLYSPNYLYAVSSRIHGINLNLLALPSERFAQIENWYIDTQRHLK